MLLLSYMTYEWGTFWNWNDLLLMCFHLTISCCSPMHISSCWSFHLDLYLLLLLEDYLFALNWNLSSSSLLRTRNGFAWRQCAVLCTAYLFLDGITVVFCCNYMLMAMRMQCTCIWLSGIVALCLEIDLLFHFPALKNWNATGLGWPNVLA